MVIVLNNENIIPEVAALGTCNIDFLMKVPRFLKSDDEVEVEKLKVSLGGSASNFAVGLSRVGVDVGIIARVGQDNFGDLAAKILEEEGVKIDRLLKISESTGMAFIAVDKNGERSIYTSMGANAGFELEKKDIEYIKRSKLLHVTGMYKEVVEEAIRYAKLISINPGTVLCSYGIDVLERIIRKAHILFLNKKEVSILTGENFQEGVKVLVEMDIPMVVVTCGKDGANLYTPDGMIHAKNIETEPLDTTGAGDAFAAGFIAAYIKNKGMDKCLELGNILASNCVSKLGAINVPRIDELDF